MSFFEGIEFICHGDIPKHPFFYKDREFCSYYGIQYNHAGRCRLQIGEKEETILNEGYVFFTAPGRRYSYGAIPGETRHHSFICFRGPRVNQFIAGGLFSPYADPPVFKVPNQEQFYRQLLELHHLLLSPKAFRAARKIHLLEGLLLSICEQTPDTIPIAYIFQNGIENLRKRIMDEPERNWNFAEEAKKMSVSLPHFRRIFSQYIGIPPNRFLIECRLNSAAKMLLESSKPINEIAHACGYPDEFYFYRLFKQYRFCTALAYRKKFGQ